MLDFKTIVESLLVENVNETNRADWVNKLIELGKKFGQPDVDDELYSKIEQLAIVDTGTPNITKQKLMPVFDGAYILNMLLTIRFKRYGKAKAGASLEDFYTDPKTDKIANELIATEMRNNKWNIENIFNFTAAYNECLSSQSNLKKMLGDKLIQQYSNLPVLGATIAIIKNNLKKDYSTYITEIFYNPEKFKTGGTVPPELRGDLDDLILLSLYTGALYETLTGLAPKKESWVLPAIGTAAVAYASKDALFNLFKHLTNDKDYRNFISKGVVPEKTPGTLEPVYTVKEIMSLSLDEAKKVIDSLKDLSYHTNTGPSLSQRIGSAVTNIAGGLEGVSNALSKF